MTLPSRRKDGTFFPRSTRRSLPPSLARFSSGHAQSPSRPENRLFRPCPRVPFLRQFQDCTKSFFFFFEEDIFWQLPFPEQQGKFPPCPKKKPLWFPPRYVPPHLFIIIPPSRSPPLLSSLGNPPPPTPPPPHGSVGSFQNPP